MLSGTRVRPFTAFAVGTFRIVELASVATKQAAKMSDTTIKLENWHDELELYTEQSHKAGAACVPSDSCT